MVLILLQHLIFLISLTLTLFAECRCVNLFIMQFFSTTLFFFLLMQVLPILLLLSASLKYSTQHLVMNHSPSSSFLWSGAIWRTLQHTFSQSRNFLIFKIVTNVISDLFPWAFMKWSIIWDKHGVLVDFWKYFVMRISKRLIELNTFKKLSQLPVTC